MRRLLLAFPLLPAACAGQDVTSTLQPPGFLREAPELVREADWNAAQTVEVRLSNYAFTPGELTFRRGQPVRLVLVNDTGSDHTFESGSFFETIAVRQLSGPEGDLPGPWVEKVVVPERQTKELWFVPARYGAFRYACSMPGHAALGMKGVVNVVE